MTVRHPLSGLLILLAALGAKAQDEQAVPPLEWPREIATGKATILVYQPQLEELEGDVLSARAAVSVTLEGAEEPVFGAAWFRSVIHTDRAERIVRIVSVQVSDAKFPNATEEQLEEFAQIVQAHFAEADLTLDLDRMLAGLELAEQQQQAAEGLKHEPPEIHFVTHPALLVLVDGEPQLTRTEGSPVMRVVNTPYYMLFDGEAKTWFLLGGGEWYAAPEFEGPWETGKPVSGAVADYVAKDESAPDAAVAAELKTKAGYPEILVSTGPAELIQTDGEPKYTPIAGTGLLVLGNTDSDVFLEIDSQRTFALVSGRWYATKSLANGPWEHVAPDALPEEFRKLPAEGDKAHVRASVPGTDEAREAVLDTYVPQTATVKRDEARLEVTYDGEPAFEKVEGNEALSYAVNTSFSVFLVKGRYYCCHDAVWFEAPGPKGPWTVCTEVPEEIYTVPPSNPHYNVRYVYVYDSTPEVVYVGYYPGYLGCYPYYGTCVYGTGWTYRPWYRVYYYPRPVTFGFRVVYNPWTGNWGFGIGWRGPYGYVGIGYGGGGWFAGGGVGVGGWWGVGGYHRTTVNIRNEININVGNRPRPTPYDRSNIYNRRKDVDRTRDRVRGRDGQPRQRPAGAARPGTMDRRNDVFADRDGRVYRRQDNGTWQQRDRGGWKETAPDRANLGGRPQPSTRDRGRPSAQPSRPAPSRQPANRQTRSTRPPRVSGNASSNLNRQAQARQRGATRANQARAARPQPARRR